MSSLIKCLSHTQTGATVCNGNPGDITNILYSCLVTGFNTQAISSLVVTDNVATVTTSASHGYVIDDVVNISGANESIFNDDFLILTVPTVDSFTFAITTANATATGTLSAKIAPLGWDRVYSGTNKAVYRSLDPTSTQIYLRVDDTGAKCAAVNMYETMSTVDVGTDKGTDTFWCRLRTTVAPREWHLIGNKSCFYLLIAAWLGSYTTTSIYFFGDIVKFRENDPWACLLGGHSVINPTYNNENSSMHSIEYATIGISLARASSWIGGNVPAGFIAISSASVMGAPGTVLATFPSVTNNRFNVTPVYVWESAVIKTYRGKMPGMFAPLEHVNGYIPSKTKYTYNNKRFLVFRAGYGDPGSSSGSSAGGNWVCSLETEDW